MSDTLDFILGRDISQMESIAYLNIGGKNLEFAIRPLTRKENSRFRKECNKVSKKGVVDYNSERYEELVCIECTKNPNFKLEENIKKAGCVTPTEFLTKKLLPGEITELSTQILKLSGFNSDGTEKEEEQSEEAKN